MALSLFGFSLKKNEEKENSLDGINFDSSNIIDLESEGSSDIIMAPGGHMVRYLENYLPVEDINRIISYRTISQCAEVDKAISEIVGDAITDSEELNELPVKVNLDKVESISEGIKEKIANEFDEIIRLLGYNNFFYKYFKQWYIDGRIYYHCVVDDNNTKAGIQKLINLDSTRIKKYREIIKSKAGVSNNVAGNIESIESVKEYFVYFPKEHWSMENMMGVTNLSTAKNIIKFNLNSISYAPSGITDENGDTISYLHKAIRPTNHLNMIEDSMIVYRMTRAPERRAFYIDVGQLPKQKAEQYISNLMAKYRNKISYDSKTGKVENGRDTQSMLEDFWLPRRDGKGTEIQVLQGGDSNIMDADSAMYFKNKLYESLNVPVSRLDSGSIFNVGRTAEITRDEVKFSKFITQLRNTFSYYLFNDILKKQLILKNIIKDSDWKDIEMFLKYDFVEDSHFAELKGLEVLRSRLEVLKDANDFIGYFSKKEIAETILRQDEKKQEELKKQRDKEKAENPPEEDQDSENSNNFGN